MAPRPIRARLSCYCAACGQPIRAGRDMLLKRFRTREWVHAKRDCIDSLLSYDEKTGILLCVELRPTAVIELGDAQSAQGSPGSGTG